MAHEHNKAAAYLRTKRHTRITIGVGLAIFMMWILGGAVGYYFGSDHKGVGALFILASMAFATCCMAFLWKHEDGLWQYFKGVGGELIVAEQLRQLSDEYHIFHGVRPDQRDGDIDHVVIGPTGVFCLDTKVWSKNTRRSARFTKSKAEALQGRLMRLRDLLGFTGGHGPYFQGSLVFLATDIPECHSRHIDWVLARDLLEYIRRTSGRRGIAASDVAAIVENLKSIVAEVAV